MRDSWCGKSTPVASSVSSPTAHPNITQRPLLISFFRVHPNTVVSLSCRCTIEPAHGGGGADAEKDEVLALMGTRSGGWGHQWQRGSAVCVCTCECVHCRQQGQAHERVQACARARVWPVGRNAMLGRVTGLRPHTPLPPRRRRSTHSHHCCRAQGRRGPLAARTLRAPARARATHLPTPNPRLTCIIRCHCLCLCVVGQLKYGGALLLVRQGRRRPCTAGERAQHTRTYRRAAHPTPNTPVAAGTRWWWCWSSRRPRPSGRGGAPPVLPLHSPLVPLLLPPAAAAPGARALAASARAWSPATRAGAC